MFLAHAARNDAFEKNYYVKIILFFTGTRQQ